MAQEIDASSGLIALPIKAKGFGLITNDIALRYDWSLDGLADPCTRHTPSSANQAMTSKIGVTCARDMMTRRT